MDVVELWSYLREVGEVAPPASELPRVQDEEDVFVIDLTWPPLHQRQPPGEAIDEPPPTWIGLDDVPVLPDGIRPGAIVGDRTRDTRALGGDWESAIHACAWYRQIAFHGPAFGIFIRQDCWLGLAEEMAPWVYPAGTTLNLRDVDLLVRLAFNFLYLHEQFHHKVESLAIRLAVAERRPVYTPYWWQAYVPHRGSPLLLEEALANADAYRRFAEPRYATQGAPAWMHPVVSVRGFLKNHFRSAPPGYREAGSLLRAQDFAMGQTELSAVVSQASLPPSHDWRRWQFATHMLRGLFPVTSSIWIIVGAGSRPLAPSTAPPLSVSTKQVERLLPKLHYRRVPGEGKGSHEKWEPMSGVGNTVTIPRDVDIPKGTLNQIAKGLGFVNGHQLALACRSKGSIDVP